MKRICDPVETTRSALAPVHRKFYSYPSEKILSPKIQQYSTCPRIQLVRRVNVNSPPFMEDTLHEQTEV